MKKYTNVIISFSLLAIAIASIWFVNKITTPHILESDLVNQCRNAGGEYSVFSYDRLGDKMLSVRCKVPEDFIFDLDLK